MENTIYNTLCISIIAAGYSILLMMFPVACAGEHCLSVITYIYNNIIINECFTLTLAMGGVIM